MFFVLYSKEKPISYEKEPRRFLLLFFCFLEKKTTNNNIFFFIVNTTCIVTCVCIQIFFCVRVCFVFFLSLSLSFLSFFLKIRRILKRNRRFFFLVIIKYLICINRWNVELIDSKKTREISKDISTFAHRIWNTISLKNEQSPVNVYKQGRKKTRS